MKMITYDFSNAKGRREALTKIYAEYTVEEIISAWKEWFKDALIQVYRR